MLWNHAKMLTLQQQGYLKARNKIVSYGGGAIEQ